MKPMTDILPGKLSQSIRALSSNFINTYSLRKTYDSLTKVLRIKVMPTELHDCCQSWWRLSEINLRRIGDLTDDEQAQLDVLVGASKIPYTGFSWLTSYILNSYSTSVRWRSVSVVTQGTRSIRPLDLRPSPILRY
jgi:hypothetical protein